MQQTPEEIRQQGLEALRERLGVVGMIRFLQQISPGTGDYTVDRRRWMDHLTLDDIQEWVREHRAKEKSKSPRKSKRSSKAAKSRR